MIFLAHFLFCFSAPPHSGCSDLQWLQDISDIILCILIIGAWIAVMTWIVVDERKPKQ